MLAVRRWPGERVRRPARGSGLLRAAALVLPLLLVPAWSGSRNASGQCLVFGDSLSKEYGIEFASDNYPSAVKNWIELLDARRPAFFDYGDAGTFIDYRLVGHEFNWSIPGGRIRDFVDIVKGKTLIDLSSRSTIASQLRSQVDRFVLFVGGNDADSVYGTPYNGGSLTAFIADFTKGVEEVLDWVLDTNGDLEIVLVNVPHVGATPKVKSEYPFDPVRTGRCTAEYARLNAALRAIADARGIGYADVFGFTAPLADPAVGWLCMDGVRLLNQSSSRGALDHLWLGGDVADDFHPNTGGQAPVANLIAEAFNHRYGTGIPLFSTAEIVESMLGLNRDVPFAEWALCHGIAAADPEDDVDRDGAALYLEFALGLDPAVPDAHLAIRTQVERPPGQPPVVSIVFRPRIRNSAHCRVDVEVSGGVGGSGWEPIPPGQVGVAPDGTVTARLPAVPGEREFVRLRARPR